MLPASSVTKLIQGEVCHGTAGVGRPVHGVIVNDNDMVVTGQVDIKLDVIDAHCQRFVIGGEGVLRRV